ncbi:AAA family ATPase [bacterium]|nr:AAA family ATPase [bacterium]
MFFIKRTLETQINRWMRRNKIIIIYGARQVGKTTLVKKILEEEKDNGLYINCDRLDVRQLLEEGNISRIRRVFGKKDTVVIDEAQRVKGIGLTLKILHDEWPELQVIATGLSSFDLVNQLREPMTGRVVSFMLYPFSMEELTSLFPVIELEEKIPFFMRYGCYPDIVQRNEADAGELLANLSDAYLYKDVLAYS